MIWFAPQSRSSKRKEGKKQKTTPLPQNPQESAIPPCQNQRQAPSNPSTHLFPEASQILTQ